MLITRTPRACERCRRTRRRCEPPHPCPPCLAAGVRCEVRVKPRPKRTSGRRRIHSTTADDAVDTTTSADASTPVRPTLTDPSPRKSSKRSGGAFEQVHELVRDLLKDECGYILECQLLEPQLQGADETTKSPEATSSYRPYVLSDELVKRLLVAFERFNGADLIDPTDLLSTGQAILSLINVPLEVDRYTDLIATHGLPLDTVANFFSALALGAVISGESDYSRFCFDVSTALAERFVGSPSLDLCLAYFLQHGYILRAGTSTHARAIVAQTVQACHDLKLHLDSHGVRGLHLYLLVYMADQYSSQTYNTPPIIHASSLPAQAFEPLAASRPHLRHLIDLVKVNGHVIEHCHETASLSMQDLPFSEVVKLEAMIGAVRARKQRADWSHKSFTDICEPIARVHMLCCRIQLRVPGLSDPGLWVPSISISVHAAAGVLSTYFQLYLPALRTLALRASDLAATAAGTCVLPPTWRQVKRITLCVLLIILAYWRGELAHDEASRHLAMARLSLEYHRSKWGNQLNEALLVISDVSRLAGFRLQESMRTLLPSDNLDFPLPIEHETVAPLAQGGQPSNGFDRAVGTSCSDGIAFQHNAPFNFTQWPDNMTYLAATSSDFDISTDISSLSFWQLTEGAFGDAMFL